jgi:mRNA interferase MazF
VVIVQADEYNRSALRTVVAVVLTTNLRLADAPGNVLLRSHQTGLSKDCVANVTQLVTADKSFLTECVGHLPGPLLTRVEEGIRQALDL